MTAARLRQRTIAISERTHAPRHDSVGTLHAPPPRQPACAESDCSAASIEGQSYCLAHVLVLRARLAERRCGERQCARPRYNKAAVCRQHLESSLFGRVVSAEDGEDARNAGREPRSPLPPAPRPVCRRAASTSHVRRVRGLEFTYSAVPREGSQVVRLAITGYVRGEKVGSLSASLNAERWVSIRMIHVEPEYRRRGVASALYEVFRAEHPRIPVGHGHRTPPAIEWWRRYCTDRGLDPLDPLS